MDQTDKDPIISAPSETPLWTKLALMTASVAAIGAVFGAFYLGTVFSNAPREAKPVAAAETTGSASTQKEEAQIAASEPAPVETADAANCREQTWPYIARPCLANEKPLASAKSGRGVRVISTDKLSDPVIGVVEAPPDAVINRAAASLETKKAQPAPPAAAAAKNPAQATPLKSGAALGALAFDPGVMAPPAPEPVVAASPPQPVAAPVLQPQPAEQATAAVEPLAVPDKRSEKSKRKAAKRQDDRAKESDRVRIVTTQSGDDDDDEPVIERRSGRTKGRVVEREYNVPSQDGGGTRRVIVTSPDRDDVYRERAVSTERGGFPNIFGAIFGNN